MAVHRRNPDMLLPGDGERRKQSAYPFDIMMSEYCPLRTKHAECAQFFLELPVSLPVSRIGLQRIVADKSNTAGSQQSVYLLDGSLLAVIRWYTGQNCNQETGIERTIIELRRPTVKCAKVQVTVQTSSTLNHFLRNIDSDHVVIPGIGQLGAGSTIAASVIQNFRVWLESVAEVQQRNGVSFQAACEAFLAHFYQMMQDIDEHGED